MFKIIKKVKYEKLLNEIEKLKFEISLKGENLKLKKIVDNFENTKEEVKEDTKESEVTFPILEEEIDLIEFKTILKENEKVYCKKVCSGEYSFNKLYEKIGLYKNCDGILKLKESFENIHVFGIFTSESIDNNDNFRTVQKVIEEQKIRSLDSILQIIEEIKIKAIIENL